MMTPERQELGRGNQHGFVDVSSAHVEGASKNAWEPKYIVDLIRVVRPSCRDDFGSGLNCPPQG